MTIKKVIYDFVNVCLCFLMFESCCFRGWEQLENRRVSNLTTDLHALYSNVDIPCVYFSLDDIIELTLNRNIDLVVKQQEYYIQQAVASRDELKMLPLLNLGEQFTTRNKNTGSFSESLVPNVPPAPPSISSEQNDFQWNTTLTWNLLDFGISYFRARQEANKAIMAWFEYQRVQQNLLLEVTRQYWKAMAAKKAIDNSYEIIKRIIYYQEKLKINAENRLISETVLLKNNAQLIEIKIQLHGFQKDYHAALAELRVQMGLPTCILFELLPVIESANTVEPDDVCELEEFALMNRPELFFRDVEERVMVDEVRVALIQMMPGLVIYGGNQFDSNRFLIWHYWLTAGVQVIRNLLAYPYNYRDEKVAEGRRQLAVLNRLGVSIGVLTQVNLAYLVFYDQLAQYRLIKELQRAKEKLVWTTRKQVEVGESTDAELLLLEAQALFTAIDAVRAYGEVQVALEQLNNALGAPFFYSNELDYEHVECDKDDDKDNEESRQNPPEEEVSKIDVEAKSKNLPDNSNFVTPEEEPKEPKCNSESSKEKE